MKRELLPFVASINQISNQFTLSLALYRLSKTQMVGAICGRRAEQRHHRKRRPPIVHGARRPAGSLRVRRRSSAAAAHQMVSLGPVRRKWKRKSKSAAIAGLSDCGAANWRQVATRRVAAQIGSHSNGSGRPIELCHSLGISNWGCCHKRLGTTSSRCYYR